MSNRPLFHVVRNQKPLVAGEHTTIREACRMMWERRAGSLLVVDRDRKLIGIFTGRDAVRLLARNCAVGETRLSDAMTTQPVTLSPQDRAVDALRAMSQGGFRHMPVVENGELKGVVSRGDLKGMEFEEYSRLETEPSSRSAAIRTLGEVVSDRKPAICQIRDTVENACRLMSRAHTGAVLVVDARQRLRGIFTGRDAVRAVARHAKPCAMQLSKAMTDDPHALPPDATAVDALRAMNDGGFRHVPVTSGDQVLGLVSRQDFTGTELDRIDEEERLCECIW